LEGSVVTAISALKGMGPAMEEACARGGIGSVEALQEIGVDAAYAAMIAAGTRPHFIGFYALEMALQGRPWNDCRGEEKAALRARFDRVKAGRDTDREAFEAAMDAIGVVEG
jgi:hypothetical protein